MLFAGTRWLGVNALLRSVSRQRLLVICYHGVISEEHPKDTLRTRNAVSVCKFREQLCIVRRFFNPVSATDVLAFINGNVALPDYPVLVTFDDGFRNNLTCAAPELERQGVPALINVTTGLIGQDRMLWTQELDERILGWQGDTVPMPNGAGDAPLPFGMATRVEIAQRIRQSCKCISNDERESYLDRLREAPFPGGEAWHRELFEFASWDEVRALNARGFAIGSHTVHHCILTRLDRPMLEIELRESKSTIERELDQECPYLAYPNGGPDDYSPKVIAMAADAGYSMAFTSVGSLNSRRLVPLQIDRVTISGGLSKNSFHALVSGLHARLC